MGGQGISVNPTSFSVSGMRGRTDSISQTMTIANSGSGTLTWSASKTATWLNLSSENGTGNGSVTLSENLTGLDAGVYTDNITIVAAGASNSPLIVPVTLTVTSGGGSSFVYDGDGRRIKKTENGQTILYINQYFEKNLTTGEVITYYYMGARSVSMRKDSSLMYVHQDHLTGTSLMTDSTGAQVGATMKYYPFGAARSGYIPTDKKFTGQRLDESGLYYYNARYYDPQIGRFISADTIVPGASNPQAFNHYSYASNNPLRYMDPSGHLCDAGGTNVDAIGVANMSLGYWYSGGSSSNSGPSPAPSFTSDNPDQSFGWAVNAANNLLGYAAFGPDGTANSTDSSTPDKDGIPNRCPRDLANPYMPEGVTRCRMACDEYGVCAPLYEIDSADSDLWVKYLSKGVDAFSVLPGDEKAKDGWFVGIYMRGHDQSRSVEWNTAHELGHFFYASLNPNYLANYKAENDLWTEKFSGDWRYKAALSYWVHRANIYEIQCDIYANLQTGLQY